MLLKKFSFSSIKKDAKVVPPLQAKNPNGAVERNFV